MKCDAWFWMQKQYSWIVKTSSDPGPINPWPEDDDVLCLKLDGVFHVEPVTCGPSDRTLFMKRDWDHMRVTHAITVRSSGNSHLWCVIPSILTYKSRSTILFGTKSSNDEIVSHLRPRRSRSREALPSTLGWV